MNRTDILTGRIVQRIIDAKLETSSKVVVVHGVSDNHDIDKLINNLFIFFPNSLIALRRLKFGYELKIDVD